MLFGKNRIKFERHRFIFIKFEKKKVNNQIEIEWWTCFIISCFRRLKYLYIYINAIKSLLIKLKVHVEHQRDGPHARSCTGKLNLNGIVCHIRELHSYRRQIKRNHEGWSNGIHIQYSTARHDSVRHRTASKTNEYESECVVCVRKIKREWITLEQKQKNASSKRQGKKLTETARAREGERERCRLKRYTHERFVEVTSAISLPRSLTHSIKRHISTTSKA